MENDNQEIKMDVKDCQEDIVTLFEKYKLSNDKTEILSEIILILEDKISDAEFEIKRLKDDIILLKVLLFILPIVALVATILNILF